MKSLVFLFITVPVFALRIAVIPEAPLPGDPLSIAVEGVSGDKLTAKLVNERGTVLVKAPLFDLNPREFVQGNIVKGGLLAVPSTAQAGKARIRIENISGLIGEYTITIGKRDFVSEEIALDKRNTDIRAVPSPEKTAQANRLWAILSKTGTAFYAAGLCFTPPVPADTRRTSFFGDRRVYRYSNGETSSAIHAGIDYGVPTGTRVAACAPGRVVLAGFRETTGNSVVLEHLPGLYSLYYHLSKLNVGEGAFVKQGDIVGESGATGIATGPHLHWEIRIAGENTDPDACVTRPLFDKEALLKLLGK